MRIHVVCGAGASSTFVALRVRRTMRARDVSGTVTAGSVHDLTDQLGTVDVVLIGPHLAESAAEIRGRARECGVAVAILPDTVFAARDGNLALDLALTARAAEPEQPHTPERSVTASSTHIATTTREVLK